MVQSLVSPEPPSVTPIRQWGISLPDPRFSTPPQSSKLMNPTRGRRLRLEAKANPQAADRREAQTGADTGIGARLRRHGQEGKK